METYLLQFKLGHFLTFDDVQTFSMVASQSSEKSDHLIKTSGYKILKTSCIYGANSSGKSNFVKGFMYSRMRVVKPSNDHFDYGFDDLKNYAHINGKGKSSGEPSYFEYILMLDGRVFSFGFEAHTGSNTLMSEWFVEIFNDGSEETIYAVDLTNEYSGDKYYANLFEKYCQTDRTETFLHFIHDSGDDHLYSNQIDGLLKWFTYGLKVVTSSLEKCYIPVQSDFICKLEKQMRNMDIRESIDVSIKNGYTNVGYNYFSDCINDHLSNRNMLITMPNKFESIRFGRMHDFEKCEFFFKHEKGGMRLPFQKESEGTRKLLFLLTLLMSHMDDISNTVIVDEMECNLHSLICMAIINKQIANVYNCNQLIITTHETHIMDDARLDEIWIIDSDTDTNEKKSRIYSLQEFTNVEYKNLNNDYLRGIYGGTPFIRGD